MLKDIARGFNNLVWRELMCESLNLSLFEVLMAFSLFFFFTFFPSTVCREKLTNVIQITSNLIASYLVVKFICELALLYFCNSFELISYISWLFPVVELLHFD